MSMLLVNILFLIDGGNTGEPENDNDGKFNILMKSSKIVKMLTRMIVK